MSGGSSDPDRRQGIRGLVDPVARMRGGRVAFRCPISAAEEAAA
jgi:hypothetical protein